MKKIEKLSNFTKGIFFLIVLFFSIGIYLSIPVLFNYKSIENIIEKKFFSDFNINLNINGDIKYQLLPKPHLLISNSSLSIDKKNEETMSIDIEKFKVFLHSKNLYPKSKLNFEVLKVAKKIASKSNLTIKIGKQTFYNQLEMPLKKAYAYTSKMMTLNMMAMDAKEGISAFLEKRKPKWKNK